MELEQSPNSWQARDELFKAMMKGVYGWRFRERQIERIVQQKTSGTPIPLREMIGQIAIVLLTGLTAKKVEARKQALLGRLNDQEQEVTKLSVGLYYCGPTMSQGQVALQMGILPEQADAFARSAFNKLTNTSLPQR